MPFFTKEEKKRTWGLSTPNNGTYFEAEYNQLYDNTDYLKAEVEANDADIATNAANIEANANAIATNLTNNTNAINSLNDSLSNEISTNVANITNALTPVGSVIPWLPGYFTNGVNGFFTPVSITLPTNWRECNGQVVNDSESPIFNDEGKHVPNLTDSRFLMGGALGAIGGSNDSMAHTHSFTNSTVPAHGHGFTQPSGHNITQPTFSVPNHKHWLGYLENTSGAFHRYVQFDVNGTKMYPILHVIDNIATSQLPTEVITRLNKFSSNFYTNTDGGGACSRTSDVSIDNNHSGGAVHSAGAITTSGGSVNSVVDNRTNQNMPKYLAVKYIIRIK